MNEVNCAELRKFCFVGGVICLKIDIGQAYLTYMYILPCTEAILHEVSYRSLNC